MVLDLIQKSAPGLDALDFLKSSTKKVVCDRVDVHYLPGIQEWYDVQIGGASLKALCNAHLIGRWDKQSFGDRGFYRLGGKAYDNAPFLLYSAADSYGQARMRHLYGGIVHLFAAATFLLAMHIPGVLVSSPTSASASSLVPATDSDSDEVIEPATVRLASWSCMLVWLALLQKSCGVLARSSGPGAPDLPSGGPNGFFSVKHESLI